MFHGHLDYFPKPPLGGRPNTTPEDHGTPNAHSRWFLLFHHVWRPEWIEIHWNSIWLRPQSHTTSQYTQGPLTTLHDFGGVLGRPLDIFLLGSHDFMVTALSSCVKWPEAYQCCDSMSLGLQSTTTTHGTIQNQQPHVVQSPPITLISHTKVASSLTHVWPWMRKDTSFPTPVLATHSYATRLYSISSSSASSFANYNDASSSATVLTSLIRHPRYYDTFLRDQTFQFKTPSFIQLVRHLIIQHLESPFCYTKQVVNVSILFIYVMYI